MSERKFTKNGQMLPDEREGYDAETTKATDRRLNGEHSAEDRKLIAKFMSVKDWAGFIDLNRQSLRGQVDFSPYHAGPIYSETKPLVPGLLRLHDFGILTIESQPSQLKGPVVTPANPNHECCKGKDWMLMRDLPYLSFIVPDAGSRIKDENLRAFSLELVQNQDFYASLLSTGVRCKTGRCFKRPKFISTFPEDRSTHLTKKACHPLTHCFR